MKTTSMVCGAASLCGLGPKPQPESLQGESIDLKDDPWRLQKVGSPPKVGGISCLLCYHDMCRFHYLPVGSWDQNMYCVCSLLLA